MIAAVVAAATLILSVAPPADPAAASALRGAQAYVAYANAHGGIRGKQLVLSTEAPADAVFAFEDLPRYAPPPRAEGDAYGRYLAAQLSAERVAVLWSGDDAGRLLLAGLRRSAAAQVVASGRIDPALPDVATQLAALQASGATVLCVLAPAFAADVYAALAQLRWKPALVAAASPVRPPVGTVSADWLSTASPLFRTIGRSTDRAYVSGLAAAFTAVDVLRRAGDVPTAVTIARAAAALNEANNPFLLSGIKVRPAAATAQLTLARWLAGRWQAFGGLLTARA